jgi:hypothetical protein
LEGQLRLQPLDSARQVPDLEEPPHVDTAALEDVIPVDVRQTAGTNVQPRPRDNAVQNTEVIKMMLFNLCRGLHFHETPSTVSSAVKNIDADQHNVMLEHSLEDCRNVPVGD